MIVVGEFNCENLFVGSWIFSPYNRKKLTFFVFLQLFRLGLAFMMFNTLMDVVRLIRNTLADISERSGIHLLSVSNTVLQKISAGIDNARQRKKACRFEKCCVGD